MVSIESEQRSTLPSVTESNHPRLSVIVPTYNRASYLNALLDALGAQVYPASRLEVIVVDNDSTDSTEAVVRAAAAAAPFPIAYYRKENRGPAAARNYGIARSSGELLAFTDSDCLPSPRWLPSAVASLGAKDGLVCGPILPINHPDDPLMVHQVRPTTRDTGIYPTANVLYRRSALEQVGGFDEQFGAYAWGLPIGGEDTDLAWRLRRAGYGAVFAPLAVVHHRATPLPLRTWLLQPIQVQILPRLLVTIPELRETSLWRRYFLGPHTATFYPALIGLALVASRRRWGWFLIIPWLRVHQPALAGDLWPPQRWPSLLLKLAVITEWSTALVLVLAWASARARRLVL